MESVFSAFRLAPWASSHSQFKTPEPGRGGGKTLALRPETIHKLNQTNMIGSLCALNMLPGIIGTSLYNLHTRLDQRFIQTTEQFFSQIGSQSKFIHVDGLPADRLVEIKNISRFEGIEEDIIKCFVTSIGNEFIKTFSFDVLDLYFKNPISGKVIQGARIWSGYALKKEMQLISTKSKPQIISDSHYRGEGIEERLLFTEVLKQRNIPDGDYWFLVENLALPQTFLNSEVVKAEKEFYGENRAKELIVFSIPPTDYYDGGDAIGYAIGRNFYTGKEIGSREKVKEKMRIHRLNEKLWKNALGAWTKLIYEFVEMTEINDSINIIKRIAENIFQQAAPLPYQKWRELENKMKATVQQIENKINRRKLSTEEKDRLKKIMVPGLPKRISFDSTPQIREYLKTMSETAFNKTIMKQILEEMGFREVECQHGSGEIVDLLCRYDSGIEELEEMLGKWIGIVVKRGDLKEQKKVYGENVHSLIRKIVDQISRGTGSVIPSIKDYLGGCIAVVIGEIKPSPWRILNEKLEKDCPGQSKRVKIIDIYRLENIIHKYILKNKPGPYILDTDPDCGGFRVD